MSNEFDYIPFSETGTPEPQEGYGVALVDLTPTLPPYSKGYPAPERGKPFILFESRDGLEHLSIPIPPSIADECVGCEYRIDTASDNHMINNDAWHWQLKKDELRAITQEQG